MATTINLNLDLDSLSDVDLTGQAIGFVLVYDGTNWVPTDTVFLDEANGYVGIGDQTPNTKLNVKKPDGGIVMVVESGNGNASSFQLRNTEGAYNIYTDGNDFFIQEQGGSSAIFKINNGSNNVSIEIFSSVIRLNAGGNNTDVQIYGTTDQNLLRADAGNDRIGIGTATPSEKLEVNGKIKATDINFTGLPTSSVGLSSGDVWNDAGTLKIV